MTYLIMKYFPKDITFIVRIEIRGVLLAIKDYITSSLLQSPYDIEIITVFYLYIQSLYN